ncbi:hypothetical protein FOZ63_031787 [Perkinsus olseni]|uniref:Uncharacterized protein n=1 Tax=Perkinsus olseni TaxID=32597 RepID=A0A7J6ST90_PEROL|nr:hypothetical protein FOZ62_029947 [Perkinsus olseni]KAF4736091.1 hypothetical protein FOZ63_031787 [Perkinsus olseni]
MSKSSISPLHSLAYISVHHSQMLATRLSLVQILVVHIGAYRSSGTVAGNEQISTPPFILKTVYMDPPDCINASLRYPMPTVNCYFVRANASLVNPGLLIQSPLYPSARHWPANFELFVVSSIRTRQVIDVGAFGQGQTPLTIDLTHSVLQFKILPGITIDILYDVPVFWKLGGGRKVNYGFELYFPVYLSAAVTVPNIGRVVLPRTGANATAFTTPMSNLRHYLVSNVVTKWGTSNLSAEVGISVGMIAVSIYHWHYKADLSFVISGSKDGFSFTYANKLPLFNKRL